jgi:hypothetical protein
VSQRAAPPVVIDRSAMTARVGDVELVISPVSGDKYERWQAHSVGSRHAPVYYGSFSRDPATGAALVAVGVRWRNDGGAAGTEATLRALAAAWYADEPSVDVDAALGAIRLIVAAMDGGRPEDVQLRTTRYAAPGGGAEQWQAWVFSQRRSVGRSGDTEAEAVATLHAKIRSDAAKHVRDIERALAGKLLVETEAAR